MTTNVDVISGNFDYNMSTEYANSHIPGEYAQGGLPNITGTYDPNTGGDQGTNAKLFQMTWGGYSGALYEIDKGYKKKTATNTNGTYYSAALGLDASKSSGLYGQYQAIADSVIPNHVAVIVWRRTK